MKCWTLYPYKTGSEFRTFARHFRQLFKTTPAILFKTFNSIVPLRQGSLLYLLLVGPFDRGSLPSCIGVIEYRLIKNTRPGNLLPRHKSTPLKICCYC